MCVNLHFVNTITSGNSFTLQCDSFALFGDRLYTSESYIDIRF